MGWYNHATVFRAVQSPSMLPHRENYNYNIKARAGDCTLLPISKRKFSVGHGIKGIKQGNPGQANAFYVLDEQGEVKAKSNPANAWIEKVIKYVTNYDGAKIDSRADEAEEDMKTAEYSAGGMGFQSDVEVRLKIEAHAMAICRNYYLALGYEVEGVSATHSYDFIIKKDAQARFVEVKGTQASGDTIILTKNEVELSRSQGVTMVLFLVHSIVMGRKTVKKESGIVFIADPWQVNKERLTPISYTYRLI